MSRRAAFATAAVQHPPFAAVLREIDQAVGADLVAGLPPVAAPPAVTSAPAGTDVVR